MANHLYNGIELPDIYSVYTPEIQQTHPFAYIITLSGQYYLMAHYTEVNSGADGTMPLFGDGVKFIAENGAWVESSKINLFSVVIWANADVYTEDGSVYLAASDPVPVLTLTDSDLYKKVNGQLVKHTLYKKVNGQLVPLDDHIMA